MLKYQIFIQNSVATKVTMLKMLKLDGYKYFMLNLTLELEKIIKYKLVQQPKSPTTSRQISKNQSITRFLIMIWVLQNITYKALNGRMNKIK